MKKVFALTPLFLSAFSVAFAQGTPTTNTWYVQTPYAGTTQYIEIATLQPSTLSTADHLHMTATLNNGWGSYDNTVIDAMFGNRGGFGYTYTARGAALNSGVRLVAYQPSDGSVNVYLVMGPVFGVATYSVVENIGETVYSSPPSTTSTPPGTLIFDSSNASYPPTSYTDFGGNDTVLGKLAVGAPTPVASASATAMFDVNVTNSLARLHNSTFDALLSLDSTAPGGREYWLDSAGSANSGLGAGNFGVWDVAAAAARWVINPAGNVGIGTIAPSAPLEITSNPGLDTQGTFLKLNAVSGGAGNGAAILFSNNADVMNLAKIAASDSGAWGGELVFYTAPSTGASPGGMPTERIRILDSGNVGIGTSVPGAKLEVDGNFKLTAGSGASVTYQDNTVQTTAWNGVLQGGDYAESVDITGDRRQYEPGDVLVVDRKAEGHFVKSSTPYSTAVMGIYSTRPGVVGRRQKSDRSHMTEEVPMAMIGVVPTKVTDEGGPIEPGDLLVTSSRAGFAMRGTDRTLLTGAIIGKSLGHLNSGSGLIEVAVSLQ